MSGEGAFHFIFLSNVPATFLWVTKNGLSKKSYKKGKKTRLLLFAAWVNGIVMKVLSIALPMTYY